jgi:hypothetical protein
VSVLTDHPFAPEVRNQTFMNWTLEGFICTSPSWLSVTSSSFQCCWTRMVYQLIECYQFRCHFTESQKMACYLKWEAYSGPISFEVQWNVIWPYFLRIFWTDCEMTPELTSSQCNWKGNRKRKGTDETLHWFSWDWKHFAKECDTSTACTQEEDNFGGLQGTDWHMV